MRFPIGAMTVGDILDRGLKLLLARLATFYLINLIVLSPVIVVQIGILAPQQAQAAAGRGQPVALLLSSLLLLVLAVILQPLAGAASLHVIAQEFIGQRASLGDAFRFAAHRFGRLLGASLLAGLQIGLGLVLCVIPGVLFAIWYIFVGQVVVVEGLKGNKALGRSKSLGREFQGRILGLGFLFLLLGVLLNLLSGLLDRVLPAAELVPAATGVTAVIHYPYLVINEVADFLVRIVVGSYSSVCWTLLYFDLRIRKEGYDLELAAQQQTPAAP